MIVLGQKKLKKINESGPVVIFAVNILFKNAVFYIEIAKTGSKSCANSTSNERPFFRLLAVPQDCRASEYVTNKRARQTREGGEPFFPARLHSLART